MKQTGTLYSKANNESSVEIKEPIPNVFIYFSQNSVRKLTTKTNTAGKFDFDLPLGKYQVAVSSGATSQVYQLAGGSEFELITTSKVGDFEKWVLAPAYINTDENPLVALLKSLADNANNSAVQAKSDADRAEKAMSSKQDKLEFVGSGKALKEGAFGLGKKLEYGESYDGCSFGYLADVQNPLVNYSGYIQLSMPNGMFFSIHKASETNESPRWMSKKNGIYEFGFFYDNRNTTVDSNGFIKAASPIIRLFNDRIEANGQFVEEPIFERLDTGVYKVSNTLGLAREGWYIETPKDKNGLPYFMVDWEQDEESHDVIVRVFKKKLDLETLDFVNGELVDIGQDQRWIDLRFHEEDNRGE